MHVGVIHNLAHDAMLRRPVLEPRSTTFQPLAVAIVKGVYVVVLWGDPMTKIVTAQPLSRPTQFKKAPVIEADTFEKVVESDDELAQHSQESLLAAARLHAETRSLQGNPLLVFNRAALYLQAARLGVSLDLYDLPSISPAGSEAL